MELQVVIETSARHIHLSDEDKDELFGAGYQLKWLKDISQMGQYACQETVSIESSSGERIDNIRVMGPNRNFTYIEVSLTDLYMLKMTAPVAVETQSDGMTGEKIKIIGSKSEIIRPALIVKQRHLHCDPETAKQYNLENGQMIDITVLGERALTFHNVVVRVNENFLLRCHIDTDEANAAGIKGEVKGYVIIK